MSDLLEDLAAGRITVDEARRRLARDQLVALDDLALLDAHRDARTGIPEIVLAEGKRPSDVRAITERLLEARPMVLVSRVSAAMYDAADLASIRGTYHDEANLFIAGGTPVPDDDAPRVAIMTAGTSDLPVAREAELTAQALGAKTLLLADCGVAAPARLAPAMRQMLDWHPCVCIVAAGREAALATLVSGLVPVPVIGLPVSVGYGHGGGGESALMAMLQSCSPLAVVNIDAGVIAATMAVRIARRDARLPANARDPAGDADQTATPRAPIVSHL